MNTTRFFPFFRDTLLKISLPALLTASFSLSEMRTQAQISLTSSNLVYTQNFDSFLGTSASVTTHLPGWTVSGNTNQNRHCGSQNNGGLYAFGNAPDYALGFLPTGSAPNDAYSARVTFVNNTGSKITEVEISYNFERWRPATRLNGFIVTSNLGNVSALNQAGQGSTGANCTALTVAKSVTLTGLNIANGATFYVEFADGRGGGSGSSQGVAIDDFRLEATLEAPAAQLNVGTLTAFGNVCTGSTSAEQSFSVTGTTLSGAVSVTAPAGYGISTVSGGPYTSSLSLTPASGALNQTVYVVFQPSAVQAYTGQISLSGGGASTVNVAVSGIGSAANPSVAISSNAGTTACEGAEVIFTATPTDGGANPVYQWKLNGSDVGTNSATFSSSTLNDGDEIVCELTSNALCAPGTQVLSNAITLTFIAPVTPTVSIVSDAVSAVCEGTEITFSAAVTDEGSNPAYQWKINGSDAGTNSFTFSSSTLADGDVVTCELSSDAQCAVSPVVSNDITAAILPEVLPTVTITSDAVAAVCEGTEITFSAAVTDEGSNPAYQWKINGSDAGTNSFTFSSSTLADGDVVTCELSSDAQCAVSPVVSNDITAAILPEVLPTVTITSDAVSAVCEGTEITFSAAVTDEGSNPSYQWKINGSDAGTNSFTFSSSTLADGDVVTCELSSDAQCAVSPVVSNDITAAILPEVLPTVTITSDAVSAVCEGTEITFSAAVTDEGSNPAYQWKINGSDAGTNSFTFSSSTLADGDVVTCELSSDAQCAVSPVVSNDITVDINTTLTPSVTISATPGVLISSGETVTFTATATNEGVNPVYQWLLNGANVGSNSATYVTSTLLDGDEVSCIAYSDAACAVPDSALSNTLEIAVSSAIRSYDKASFSVLAFPNPGDGNLTLQGTFPMFSQSPLYIEVCNVAGQLVYSEVLAINGGMLTHHLNLTALQHGLYLIRVVQQQEMQVLRITIGH